MLLAIVNVYVSNQNENNVLDVSTSIVDSVVLEPGCISCRVLKGVSKPHTLTLIQEWKSQGELENYIRSAAFRNTLGLIELSSEQPEVTFHTVSETKGLDFIQGVRAEETEVDL